MSLGIRDWPSPIHPCQAGIRPSQTEVIRHALFPPTCLIHVATPRRHTSRPRAAPAAVIQAHHDRPRRVSIRPVRRPLALIAPLLTAWRQARTDAGVGGRTSKIDIRSEEGYFYEGKVKRGATILSARATGSRGLEELVGRMVGRLPHGPAALLGQCGCLASEAAMRGRLKPYGKSSRLGLRTE